MAEGKESAVISSVLGVERESFIVGDRFGSRALTGGCSGRSVLDDNGAAIVVDRTALDGVEREDAITSFNLAGGIELNRFSERDRSLRRQLAIIFNNDFVVDRDRSERENIIVFGTKHDAVIVSINRAVDGDRLIRINAGNDFTINAGKLQVAGNRYILTLHSVAREGKSADSRVVFDLCFSCAVGNSRIKDHKTVNVRKLMVGTILILSKRAVLDDEFLTL